MEAVGWFMEWVVRRIEGKPQKPIVCTLLLNPGDSVIHILRRRVIGADACGAIDNLLPAEVTLKAVRRRPTEMGPPAEHIRVGRFKTKVPLANTCVTVAQLWILREDFGKGRFIAQ